MLWSAEKVCVPRDKLELYEKREHYLLWWGGLVVP
jgi:hypothetical protein